MWKFFFIYSRHWEGWWNPYRNGHQQDGLLVDLKGEEEECKRRVDESQDEVLFGRLEEEEEVGGKWRERSGSQAGHGQRLDVVELLDFNDNVDGAPHIGNLKEDINRNRPLMT